MDAFENAASNPNDTSVMGKVGDPANAGAHATIDKVSGVARTAVDSLAAGAHQGFDKATDVARQAAETFDAKREELEATQAKLIESGRSYVQKNPLMSLGIAAAIGYVVSRLLKSR
jgi:ElaB/YqjD/DUF883 family membrane-anchored ribosome-binding protein